MWGNNIIASSVLNVLLFVAKNYLFVVILGAECKEGHNIIGEFHDTS